MSDELKIVLEDVGKKFDTVIKGITYDLPEKTIRASWHLQESLDKRDEGMRAGSCFLMSHEI
jgi:hypothetical protein